MKAPNYEKTKNFSQEKAYLVPNAELRGIGIPYATASDYFDASRLMDPTVVAGDSLSILSIPSPIVGKYIHLPDGNVSGPGLAWQGEVTTGLYRIGTANVGQSVLGALKWDWNATRMKFASGFSLGINTEPSVPLHVLKSTAQLQLSYDATHSTTFYTTSSHVLEVANNQGTLDLVASAAPTDYARFSIGGGSLSVTATDRHFVFTDRGENDGTAVYFQIYNTDSGDPNAHALLELQVDPAVSGDPFIRYRVDNASSFWSEGLDNSDSDAFVLSRGSTLGTNNRLKVDTTGNLYLPIYTAGSVLYVGTSGQVSQNNAAFFWDNTNKQLDIYGTTAAQLKFGDSASMSVSHRFYDDGGAADSTYIIDPASAITHDGAFCFWYMNGSDFTFSYDGTGLNGLGVPNVTIAGPPNTGTYTSASGPGLNWNNQLESADNKLWSIQINAKVWRARAINDANNAGNDWLEVTRSGTTISSIVFPSSGVTTFAGAGVNITGGRLGSGTSGPDAQTDSLSTSLAQYRATYTDGSAYMDIQANTSGDGSLMPSGLRLGVNVAAPGASLDVASTVRTIERLRLSGADYLGVGSTGETGGIAFLPYVNTSGNRQLIITDSDTTGSSSTNAVFRIYPSAKIFDCIATDTTRLAFTLGGTGQLVLAADGISITVGASGGSVGLYGSGGGAKGTGGQNVTNNVTDSGSTAGTIPDITDGTTYANDYTNLRRALYQLARMLKQDHDQLRSMGILT